MKILQGWSRRAALWGAVFLGCLSGVGAARTQEPPAVVHALLFYSPTCPHCHQVINEHLIPLENRWGNRLVILAFDVTRPFAEPLYMGMVRHFGIPQERWVVPILVVGSEVLIGGEEIPARFPSMVEEGLAGGGIDLPDIAEVLGFLQEQDLLEVRFPGRRMTRLPPDLLPPQAADTPAAPVPPAGGGQDTAVAPMPARPDTGARRADTLARGAGGDTAGARPTPPTTTQEGEERPTPAPPPPVSLRLEEVAREAAAMGPLDRFLLDPVGNGVAVGVLVVLLFSLGWTGYPPWARGRRWPGWVVPVLAAGGLAVASYLAFVEVSGTEAVCGPVGDCHTVQQSPYARLFGVIPTAVLGVAGYGVILLLWAVGRGSRPGAARVAVLALWGTVLAGSLFSAYLTYLEPFVIGASCAWCLASALIMAALLWAAAPPAAEVWPFGPRRGP